jgi:hypothetical protein
MDQLVQVAGSLLILAAFPAMLRGAVTPDSRSYFVSNLRRFDDSAPAIVMPAFERRNRRAVAPAIPEPPRVQ